MTQAQRYSSSSLQQSDEVARSIANAIAFPMAVYFKGELGAGKTTLIKSIIHSFGYKGAVTSPTYNLIQEYPCDKGVVYHMDLYRVNDPFELEFLALGDLWTDKALFLIEWPEKGQGFLPDANLQIEISKTQDGRQIELIRL